MDQNMSTWTLKPKVGTRTISLGCKVSKVGLLRVQVSCFEGTCFAVFEEKSKGAPNELAPVRIHTQVVPLVD